MMQQGFAHGGGGGIIDVAQLQSTMREIEHACASIQMHINPAAAEATILSLSHSSQPYHACQYILENSEVANARFQASAALRDAALREWEFLTADDKRGLISFCLRYVIQHANSPEGYVQAKVSSVAAQLMKRGWLDFAAAEREAFFSEVKQAFLGIYGVGAQYTGINFIESLVSEFSPSTSMAMGLPREFHEKCRLSLELDYLKTFYCWAQEAALSVSNKICESRSDELEAKACAGALRLMLQILNWDFRSTIAVDDIRSNINVFSAAVTLDIDSVRRSECILVKPGPSWRDVLVSSGHNGWLLSLYRALRRTDENLWVDHPIAVSARKLIVQLCSLTGTIFPSDNGQMQEHHLLQLLSGIIGWIDPPDVVSKAIQSGHSESEMLDGCRVLLAIATVTTPFVFDQLLKSIRPFGTVRLLSTVMCEVIRDLMANTEEEPWSWVARDILLDTWTSLLVPVGTTEGNTILPIEGINAAAGLFALIVEAELKVASTSVHDDDDGADAYYLQASVEGMDERLSSYALIARAAIGFSIPFLMTQFSERFAKLHQAQLTDPAETLEELYSLLLIAGHVLADEGEGETPSVPKAIETHFVDYVEADKHPVVVLSGSIIKFAEQCLNPEIRASIFSSRLMEAIIWFLARWSSTYLMSNEVSNTSFCSRDQNHVIQSQSPQSRKTLLNFFGEYNQGKHVLDIVIRISMAALILFPGEKYLQSITCYQLLNALVRRKNVCKYLVAMDSWLDLANAFANDRTLFSMNGDHQRSLAQTLVLSASGRESIDETNQYVRGLMGHTTAYLVEICNKNDLKSIAQQPDVIFSVSCLLERLRGAACASEPRTQKAIYEMGFAVMSPVLILIEVYKLEFPVVYLLLKFVVDWVEGQIIYLESQETAIVINFSMRLLQLYSSLNIGMISLSLSSSLLSEVETEKYKDLRALLQLLTNLCSKDLVDFSSDSCEDQGTNISQVVYLGLHIVTPLISLDLLKYPKLCHDYFSLVSHLLEVYPEMVAQLSSEAFAHILGTLDFGIHHQDIDVVSMCLRALKALATHHYKEISLGNIGLGSHAAGFTDSSGKFQEGILCRFLRSLMQLLLFEDYSTDLVSSAADALLPLILCEHALYQRLGSELIERQENPAFKSRLTNALQSLTSSNNLSSTLDRVNYQRFRKNVHQFLVEVRGFLRTK